MTAHIQKNWWYFTIRGILAITFGIIAVLSPEFVLFALLMFIGAIALISGILLFLEGLSIKGDSDRLLRIIEGLISMLFALVILIHPVHSIEVSVFILACWVILAGIFHIITAVKLRKVSRNGLHVLNSIITILFGILLFSNLIVAAQTIIVLIGYFYIVTGLLMILQSFRLKGFQRFQV